MKSERTVCLPLAFLTFDFRILSADLRLQPFSIAKYISLYPPFFHRNYVPGFTGGGFMVSFYL